MILESTDVEDRAVAVGASRREQVVVVRLAVGPAVAFEEVPSAELLRAVRAGEVLRVPGAAQRRDHLHERTLRHDYVHWLSQVCTEEGDIPPVRQWASRRRCSIPSGGSVLLGGSCLRGGSRAYALGWRARGAGCCGSVLATRGALGTRVYLARLLCRSPVKKQNLVLPETL